MLGGLHNVYRLAVFVKVVEARSLTRAAQDLCLTQPCITKHVKALEQFLGLKLIERGSRGVEPTEGGWVVYQFARNLVETIDGLDGVVARFREAEVGKLAIGSSMAIGSYLLPPLLCRFRARYPDADVTLRIMHAEQVCQAIQDAKIEVAITADSFIPRELAVEVLCRDEVALLVGSSHPLSACRVVTPEQLSGQVFIFPVAGTKANRLATEIVNRACIAPRIGMMFDAPEAIKQAAVQGLGVALLHRMTAARELASGALHELRLQGLSFPVDYKIIYKPLACQSPILRLFVSFLRREIPALLPASVSSPEAECLPQLPILSYADMPSHNL